MKNTILKCTIKTFRYFDVVVMDEFVSVLLHSRNSMNKSVMNTNKFFKSFNKKVVIADAFLTGYEDFFFENKNADSTITIDNEYRDDCELISYTDANNLTKEILECAIAGEKLTISSTSTTYIKSLEAMLFRNKIRVTTLTSTTSQFSKDVIYNSFKREENDLFDVLIFSPTLTVGVSNLNLVDKHFHYDSSRSSDVISSLQMIKRTRKAKQIHYHVKNVKKYLPISYAELRDDYISKIGKNVEQNNLFEYDDYGNPNISKLGKLSILIDVFKNILEKSHKDAFEHLLTYHFEHEPLLVDGKADGSLLGRYNKTIQKANKENDKIALRQYLELNKLDQLNLNISNVSKSLKNIIEIRENIQSDDSVVLENMIKLQLKDSKFVDKCYYWKLIKSLKNGDIDVQFMKRLISKATNTGNMQKYNILNSIIDYNGDVVELYELTEIKSRYKLYSLLKSCGFVEDNVYVGYTHFCIDHD